MSKTFAQLAWDLLPVSLPYPPLMPRGLAKILFEKDLPLSSLERETATYFESPQGGNEGSVLRDPYYHRETVTLPIWILREVDELLRGEAMTDGRIVRPGLD